MRNKGIELLRGLSAFGIIGCHLLVSPMTDVACGVLHFCDFNVAVFAVLAGLLMDGRKDCSEYLKARLERVLFPYAAWSVVFIVASVVFQRMGSGVSDRFSNVGYWRDVVLRGGASCHLWFLVCLFYSQVLICFSGRLMPRSTFLGIGTVVVITSSIGDTFYHLYLLRMLGFVCLGYGARSLVLEMSLCGVSRRGVACLGVLVAHFFFADKLPRFVMDLVAVLPVVYFFAGMPIRGDAGSRRLGELATVLGCTSFGVFLVHPIVTRVGSIVVGRMTNAPYGVGTVLLDWVVCWLVSLAFVLIAVRIPYVKRVFQ